MLPIIKRLNQLKRNGIIFLLSVTVSTGFAAENCAKQQLVINALEEARIASDIGGTILSIPFREGERVKKGDVLLKFDCRTQEAELNKALADKRNTESNLKNTIKLESYGASSAFESVKAKSDFDKSVAEVDRLNAIVSKCSIQAPFDGSLVEKFVQPFNTVKPGEPLLKVINPNKIELVMRVPSSWLSWLTIGSKFDVFVYELNQKFPAQVDNINAQVDAVSRTVKIRGNLSTPNKRLLPGMTGEAIFSKALDKSIKCNDR